ncbi:MULTISPECIES: helix-turn-helix domain-containing protein [unclassified Mycobacterium]|uniref:helix-turn-helix domain-containing protein n=1 Tax=unclassified Mycobacterium TaxID=2642494 RepID=UPI0007FD0A5B|nr:MULTISPECIES: helix-turn-helix domain-containing protein [unclassified Mycobacterium]OBH13639.1 hypothetical protein A9X04_15665 [Mycobacterium sp. E3247]OBI14866.1 hypothetical protein A5713_01825 [Mycobacterium sp. E2497]
MALDYGELPLQEAVRAARTTARRRQLLDAAVKAMETHGFHQTSMQDLAAEAKVSVGLIYTYFGGKEELLLAHGWALKHWHFGPVHTCEQYIRLQTRHVLDALVCENRRADYAHVLEWKA